MTQDAHQPPEMDLTSLLDLSTLPDDPLVLKQLLAQLILLVRKETKRREEVERAIDALLKSLQRGKTLPDCPGQGRLFDEASDEGLTQATAGDELDAVLAGLLPGGARNRRREGASAWPTTAGQRPGNHRRRARHRGRNQGAVRRGRAAAAAGCDYLSI